ncbi:uncharacterized protein LOC110976020 [Acanthaster planci]|uniref:Uncharacterized protein LOC110976020 n=1 Tax=Acanthaster planci TaxID=133434 RepID=A0A8B7XUV5_ACAPL|nr:uncharacterized protein LOC110976020 [Acanthaster planci]
MSWSCLRVVVGLLCLAFLSATVQVSRAQTAVARLSGTLVWSYEATGIYPPSYNVPAQVSIQLRAEARADTDTITGTGLWDVTIFGNREGDGSGTDRYDERTGFVGNNERAQSFSPTDSLAFDESTAFDLSGLACGSSGPYLCVQVSRAADASMTFDLDPEKWISCRSTPCYYPDDSADASRDIIFSELRLDQLDTPSVPRDEPIEILLVVTAVPSASSRQNLEGTGLWRVSIFGSKSTDGTGGDRYDERPQVLTTTGNTDKSLVAGKPLQLTIRTQFLLGGVGCEDYPYFCITLDKGENPQPDFTIQGPITHCRQVNCLYPDVPPIPTARFSEMTVRLVLPPTYPHDEPVNISLQVELTPSKSPDVPTSIVEGTGLWRLAIFGNKGQNGSDGERFDERPQVLSGSDQDARLTPTDGLVFDVTTQFVIGQVGCDNFPYFCVEFGKGYGPVPNFIFEAPLTVCLEVPCAYEPLPVARAGRLSFSFTDIGTGHYEEPVHVSLNVSIAASESDPTDPIRGSRLWQLSIYGSANLDGSGDDRFDERSVLSKCQRDKPLTPGESLEFDVDADFIISGVGCYDYPYFCLKFEKGADPEPDFIMYDPLRACMELTCTPPPVPRFIISGLTLHVKPGSPTAVQAGQDGSVNYLKFIMEAIYDKRQVGEISGNRLWVLSLWGSANADGSGPKVSENPNTLTTLQSRRTLILGESFILTSVRNNFDMTGASCADVRYICVKLSRGTVPADAYEFLTEPESYLPQTCVQMGCS